MNDTANKGRATYKTMASSTKEDWKIISDYAKEFNQNLSHRILDHLRILKDDHGGFAVDRLEHSLQTASRAYKDGRDEEYVVCALLHDIGDNLAPSNHADFAATLMQPFISEKNYWIVKHHGIFQGYYFFEYLGLDKNMRDKFKDHPYFNDCKEFCEKYDQNSFDPEYESLPLDFFIPMVERVFAKPKNTIYKN